jgi:hypothetical protein
MAILLVPCEWEIWRVDRVHPLLLVSENRVQSWQELVKFAESRPKLAI